MSWKSFKHIIARTT